MFRNEFGTILFLNNERIFYVYIFIFFLFASVGGKKIFLETVRAFYTLRHYTEIRMKELQK